MSIEPQLGIVQETLLLPLIGRATVSREFPFFFRDQKAEELVDRLNFNKSRAKRSMGKAGQLAMAVRAVTMDRAIQSFIARHPNATILNIGAGLDTAFSRVDNGTIRWVDLDLPDSMALRSELLPAGDRNVHLAQSMFDYSWIDEIGDVSDGLFIQIPGVLPYIDLPTVKDFFSQVAPRLPDAEIIFDVITAWSSQFVNAAVNLAGMSRTRMEWGISDAHAMKHWTPHIEVVRQQRYFDDVEMDWRFGPLTNIMMRMNDVWKVGQIYHLRFV